MAGWVRLLIAGRVSKGQHERIDVAEVHGTVAVHVALPTDTNSEVVPSCPACRILNLVAPRYDGRCQRQPKVAVYRGDTVDQEHVTADVGRAQ